MGTMNKFSSTILITLGLIFSGIFNQVWAKEAPSEQLLDGIVAIVNDEIILRSELESRAQMTASELAARRIPIQDTTELALKVLDALILEKLQFERIQQLGIQATDEEVVEHLQKVAKENGLSLEALRLTLNRQSPNGFREARDQIREQMLLQKLKQKEVIEKTQVTESEIDNYLQRMSIQNNAIEYRLKHIMLALPEGATPQTRTQVEADLLKLRQRILNGEDFSQVAVRHSQGNKALEGGDLGWLSMDAIPTFFSETVTQLESGQTSQVIRSPIGFHIIQLAATRDKNSELVKEYDLHQFTLLSDNAKGGYFVPNQVTELVSQIKTLEDFNQLYSHFPDMTRTANQEPHKGWKTLNMLASEFSEPLEKVQTPGQAVGPIATDEGWVILYVDNIREKDLNRLSLRQQAMQNLRVQKANETYEIWLRRLKEEATIDNRFAAAQKEATE